MRRAVGIVGDMVTGDQENVEQLGRFAAQIGDQGRWVVVNQRSGYTMPAVSYDTRDQADAYADVLNAADEGEPVAFVEQLRGDLDAIRTGGR